MNNFGGLTKEFSDYQTAKVVVLPIEFDKSVSWLGGAAKGPKAIIDASTQVELYDIETDTEVYKHGIFTSSSIKVDSSKDMISQAYDKTLGFLEDNKFVITLGGDHSVTIGPLKAHEDFHTDISVLHLDAHADMRDIYDDNKFSHACVMARASEIVSNIVSVGIRSMDVSEKNCLSYDRVFLADTIYRDYSNRWVSRVIQKLGEKVYLSIDVDVFDMGIMPSTGTPEPGGLNWHHVIRLMKMLFITKKVIGMDAVELAPTETNKAPDFLVAKLIYKILSYKFKLSSHG